jgi:hypothetical protein
MRDLELVKEMNRRIKRFDGYEKKEKDDSRFFRCGHCNPIANLFPESEIFWDDECGYLCERCLGEEERAREAEAEVRIIEDNEKKFHDKGGL